MSETIKVREGEDFDAGVVEGVLREKIGGSARGGSRGSAVPLRRLEPHVPAEDRGLGGRAAPPAAGTLPPKAHDMGRESGSSRSCTRPSRSPRSPTSSCDDEAIIGAPFYVMERRTGVVRGRLLPGGRRADRGAVPRDLPDGRGHARRAARRGPVGGRPRGPRQARGISGAADEGLDRPLRQGQDRGDRGGRAAHRLARRRTSPRARRRPSSTTTTSSTTWSSTPTTSRRSGPSSTGRWRPSATRSSTSPSRSPTGSSPATRKSSRRSCRPSPPRPAS